MNFDPGEREYLLWSRALTTDVHGREIFVGLTREESDEYFALTRPGGTDSRPGEPMDARRVRSDRYLELHGKMERARFAVIGAEHVVRTENPTRN